MTEMMVNLETFATLGAMAIIVVAALVMVVVDSWGFWRRSRDDS